MAAALYEASLAGRLAKLEPTSFSWLARECAPTSSPEDARSALVDFGRKRSNELEVVHVVCGQKRIKSSFSDGNITSREISLVREKEVGKISETLENVRASPYSLFPNGSNPSHLGILDAQRGIILMTDDGEAGEAFRRNSTAPVQLQSLEIKPLKDWATISAVPAGEAQTVGQVAQPAKALKEKKAAKTQYASFFGAAQKSAKITPATCEQNETSQARRRVVDDEEDDDGDEPAKKQKTSSHIVDVVTVEENTQASNEVEPAVSAEEEEEERHEEVSQEEEQERQDTVGELPAAIATTTAAKTALPRLVEKTYVDDKGYLVTQKVWTDSSGEIVAEPKDKVGSNAEDSTNFAKDTVKQPLLKPTKKAASAVKPRSKGQTSLFGFFKK